MRLMRFGDNTLLPERAHSACAESLSFETFLCRYALRASYDTKKEEKNKRKILNIANTGYCLGDFAFLALYSPRLGTLCQVSFFSNRRGLHRN